MFLQQVQAIVNTLKVFDLVSCYILVAFEGEGLFCVIFLLGCLLAYVLLNLVTGTGTVFFLFSFVMGGAAPYTSHFVVFPFQLHSRLSHHCRHSISPGSCGTKVDFVLDGMHHGFKLGFCHTQQLKPAKKNKPSAD